MARLCPTDASLKQNREEWEKDGKDEPLMSKDIHADTKKSILIQNLGILRTDPLSSPSLIHLCTDSAQKLFVQWSDRLELTASLLSVVSIHLVGQDCQKSFIVHWYTLRLFYMYSDALNYSRRRDTERADRLTGVPSFCIGAPSSRFGVFNVSSLSWGVFRVLLLVLFCGVLRVFDGDRVAPFSTFWSSVVNLFELFSQLLMQRHHPQTRCYHVMLSHKPVAMASSASTWPLPLV